MEVVIFNPHHIEVMQLRDHERELLMGVGDMKNRLSTLMQNSKAAGTFLYQGRIITCAGFVEIWPGVAELWQLPSIYVSECALVFSKTLKKYVENVAKNFQYHRLQTSCPSDQTHDRWMEFLGFVKEGTMKQYTFNKQDYSIFGRVFSWA